MTFEAEAPEPSAAIDQPAERSLCEQCGAVRCRARPGQVRCPAYATQNETAPEWFGCCFTTLARKGQPSQCPLTASVYSASRGISPWRSDIMKPAKNTICLWYDGDAEGAARFYAKTFPDSSV